MVVRLFAENDIDSMVEIWLAGSKEAHRFIPSEYWESNRSVMQETYLPMSQSYVLEAEGALAGFISMVDDYLAALFVSPAEQGKGYGKILLNYVKNQKETITLKVYQENDHAVRFYQKNGFVIASEAVDENTSSKEYVMVWNKKD